MTTGIIPNANAAWYDTGLSAGNSVLVTQMNYAGASNDFSALKTRVRFMQDMGRNNMPNTIRQGLGLAVNGTEVTIAAGDATIAGRWAWTDTGDIIDCVGLEPGGPAADYYVIWRIEVAAGETDPINAVDRDPQDETAVFKVIRVSAPAYVNSPFEIILGKVSIDNGIPTFVATTDKYTDIPDQWAVGRIVPRTRSADNQNSYSSVKIAYAAGGREIVDQISTEEYGVRIYNQLQLDDENDVVPVSLKNVDGVIMAREDAAVDLLYVPVDALSYRIGGVEIISSTGTITNPTIIGATLNGFTLAGNIVSIASRRIQLDNASDTTLFIENTLAGVANVDIQGNMQAASATLDTPLGVVSGGTGANTAGNARTNLGIVIGTDVQTQDAGLQSIANLATVADRMIYTTALDAYVTTVLTSQARSLLDDGSFSSMRATMGVTIGSDVQAFDTKLKNLVNQTGAANRVLMYAGANTWTHIVSGAAGRIILNKTLDSDVRSYLNLVVGTNIQAFDATLQEIAAGPDPTANQFLYWSSATNTAVLTSGSVGRTLLTSTTSGAARSTIGAAPTSHLHTLSTIGLEVIQYSPAQLSPTVEGATSLPDGVHGNYNKIRFFFANDNTDHIYFQIPYINNKTVNRVWWRIISDDNKLYKVRLISSQDGANQVATSYENFTSVSGGWTTHTHNADILISSSLRTLHMQVTSRSGLNTTLEIASITVEYND